MLLSHWALLGFVAWTLLVLVGGIGVARIGAILRKEAKPSSFNPSVVQGTDGYQRRMRAHLNCVENLPVFAALVLLGSATGLTSSLFQAAAFAVLPARIGHTVAHVASGRNRAILVRFAFYCVQLACFTIMIALLVMHGLAQEPASP